MAKKPATLHPTSTINHNPFMDLLAGISTVTGEDFFQNFVEHMAKTYQAQYALVTELLPGKPDTVKTLAFYAHDNHMANFEYRLQDTPCACAYENDLTKINLDLQQRFPKDSELVEMGVNSYLGMPLYNKNGLKIGHICILGTHPVGDYDYADDYLKIFSSRAGAELERLLVERDLIHQRQQLSSMVDEQTSELRSAKNLAEQANHAKTEFLARMSHELKTPLNAIHGFTQLMHEETAGELNAVYKGYIGYTLTASKHLKNIIDDLLDFSVIEIGKLKINITACPVKEAINECIPMVTGRADSRGITIQLADDAGLSLIVLADPSRLNEIIINLLTNAIKYNHEDGQISINVQPSDATFVRVSVTDTGPGIPKVDQARIFNEFERLSTSEDCVEGTGLGLALTKRLTEHMDGRIGIESKLGKGSTFWFELPVAKA